MPPFCCSRLSSPPLLWFKISFWVGYTNLEITSTYEGSESKRKVVARIYSFGRIISCVLTTSSSSSSSSRISKNFGGAVSMSSSASFWLLLCCTMKVLSKDYWMDEPSSKSPWDDSEESSASRSSSQRSGMVLERILNGRSDCGCRPSRIILLPVESKTRFWSNS